LKRITLVSSLFLVDTELLPLGINHVASDFIKTSIKLTDIFFFKISPFKIYDIGVL